MMPFKRTDWAPQQQDPGDPFWNKIPEIPDLAQLHALLAAKGFQSQGCPVREKDHWQWNSMYGVVPVDTCTWTSGRTNASCCLYDPRGHAIIGWTYLNCQWIEDRFCFLAEWLCGEDF